MEWGELESAGVAVASEYSVSSVAAQSVYRGFIPILALPSGFDYLCSSHRYVFIHYARFWCLTWKPNYLRIQELDSFSAET